MCCFCTLIEKTVDHVIYLYLGGIEKVGMKYCYWKNTSDITETYTIKLKACRICAVCCKISKKLIAI